MDGRYEIFFVWWYMKMKKFEFDDIIFNNLMGFRNFKIYEWYMVKVFL